MQYWLVLGQQPPADIGIPNQVLEVADGRPLEPVWENELGGLTFVAGNGADRRYLKWSAKAAGVDLTDEADRMRWIGRHSSVAEVMELHHDAAGSALVTSPLAGDSAVSARWAADPATAVQAMGVGLRSLHDTAPAAGCPFSWSAVDRVASARGRVAAGTTDPSMWHPDHSGLNSEQVLDILGDIPPVDRLVVCHGDACAPNTIVDHGGSWSGHVDLGSLGVADRWADLSVATWSTEWNFGPGWQNALLDAYGIEPDHERITYYRLLWDLS